MARYPTGVDLPVGAVAQRFVAGMVTAARRAGVPGRQGLTRSARSSPKGRSCVRAGGADAAAVHDLPAVAGQDDPPPVVEALSA
ncbi:hypothetical protein ACFQX6_31730 [Streptosporangium lutulentum]